jgi:hypothetical protein
VLDDWHQAAAVTEFREWAKPERSRKIAQYNLSIAIPNELVGGIVKEITAH